MVYIAREPGGELDVVVHDVFEVDAGEFGVGQED
jgi:hypothetical protein